MSRKCWSECNTDLYFMSNTDKFKWQLITVFFERAFFRLLQSFNILFYSVNFASFLVDLFFTIVSRWSFLVNFMVVIMVYTLNVLELIQVRSHR